MGIVLDYLGLTGGDRPAQPRLPESGDPVLEERQRGLGDGHCPVGVRNRGVNLCTVDMYVMLMNAAHD